MRAPLVLLAACAACVSAAAGPSPQAPLVCPAAGLAAEPEGPGFVPARAEDVLVPPLPIPASVRGARADIRLVVDAQGRPMADSVLVCGVQDRRYAARLGDAAAQLTFRPARQDGRAVAAPVLLRYNL